MSDHLDEFLGISATPPIEEAPAEALPEPTAEAPALETGTEAPPAEEIAAPVPGQRQVPLSALEAERKQRQDWKEQFTRRDEQAKAIETERDTLRAQLEEAKKASPVAPPAPVAEAAPQRVPNPAEDPEGYHAFVQNALFNERLQMSEATFKASNPDVDTKTIASRFLAEAQKDPRLGVQLRSQPHPYAWAADQIKRIDAMNEIGTDPAAFRAKLEADIRAAIAAEASPAPAAVQRPQPVLPTSLATARSAAPRGGNDAPGGPPPFEQLFLKR